MIVVKVGGSLFDHPRLRMGLAAYLETLKPAKVWLVAGGGEAVEAVRKLDQVHGLGEATSHWLAVRAMGVMEHFLWSFNLGKKVSVLDTMWFIRKDISEPGGLPVTWDVTSDSIAARFAVVYDAKRLILLKSVDLPPTFEIEDAAARGWVDRHFPTVVANATFPIEVINFRRVLDAIPG